MQNGNLQAHNENIAAIPIPKAAPTEQADLEKLVAKIVALKASGGDVSDLEAEINARVYKLFGLTPDEIKLIEELK